MSYCACGNPIPDGFEVCELCEAFGDDDPLPMTAPEADEDNRIEAMDEEAHRYFGEMGVWYGEEAA